MSSTSRYLPALLACLLLLFATASPHPAVGQESQATAGSADSDLRREFDTRRAAIGSDANALFDLAREYYQRHQRRASLEALKLAQDAIAEATRLDRSHAYAPLLRELVQTELRSATKRMSPDYWLMTFAVIGGLGIFLLGMKHLSDGIQAVAGNRLRRMINAVTDNRLMAVAVGTGVTCLVQSSTITTVIVVGLVNSGLMMLHQAIGVIMGANVGTTITGWILVLQIGKYGLPLLGVSACFYLFAKRDRVKYLAVAAMGLGMVFFGLELMKDGFKPLREVPTFHEAFLWFRADGFAGVVKCVLVGSTLTALVQSSSATLGITIAIASQGLINFETAMALVLGQNVGTTITAWLASLGTTTVAKRAAYFHIAFNIIGVVVVVLVFDLYVLLMANLVQAAEGVDPRQIAFETTKNFSEVMIFSIASGHTVFNIAMTTLTLGFVRRWARLLEKYVPDKAVRERRRLTSLDMRMVDSPVMAIENCRGEILQMARGVEKMLEWTRDATSKPQPDPELVEKIFNREKILDNMQQEVIEFLTDLLTAEVPHSVTTEGRQHLRIADEYESISDYVSDVIKAYLRLQDAHLDLDQEERNALHGLHDEVADYVRLVTVGVEHAQPDILTSAETRGGTVTRHVKDLREAHLARLSQERIDPVKSMCYMSILNAYRKIRDHALNIAEAQADHRAGSSRRG
jgi:phosphate:Na+ symporter